MAGLLATYLQDIRALYPNGFDRLEWRFTQNGVLTAVQEMTDSPLSLINEDVKQKAMESEGRVLDIPVIKQGELTIKNARSCTITPFENESAMINVDWTTLVVDISMVKAQYAKNEISYTQDLAKKLLLVKETFAKAMEEALIAKMELEKSATYNSPFVGAGRRYELVGDALQVTPERQNTFFNDVEVILQGDDFKFPVTHVIGSTTLMSFVNHWANQGEANMINLQYQFAGKSFRFSNRITVGEGKEAAGYFMPDGSIGLLTRVNVDARMGNKTTRGTSWEVARIDGLPYDLGVMYYSDCQDMSALNGTGMEHLKATMVESWQFSIDFAIATPYQSDPDRAKPIKKFEFLAATPTP